MASGRRKKDGGGGQGSARLTAILGGASGSKIDRDLAARAKAAASGKGKLGADSAELLCWAAGNGQTKLVAALLKRGADARRPCMFELPPYDPHDEEHAWVEADWFGEEYENKQVALRPLGAAVHGGHADAARLLLGAGAEPNVDAGDGPPIYHAVRRGRAQVVELLIARGANLKVRGPTGHTLLYEVAGSEHADVADVLLRAGADPNELNATGDPPLIAASIRGDVRIVRALLAAGANVDPPEPTPETMTNPAVRIVRSVQNNYSPPLLRAAEIGHLEVVRMLLEASADVTRKDSHGNTAYDVARRRDHREVALLLKDAGAAKPGAAKPVDLFMAAEVGDLAAIRAALASGMDVNARSGISEKSGFGAFMKDKKIKPRDLFKSPGNIFAMLGGGLLDAIANDAEEMRQGAAWHHGMSALMIASKHRHAEAVRLLLKSGATPDLRSSDPNHSGYTALHYAAAAGNTTVMRLLLDAGADIANEAANILGEATGTPLHVAAGYGHAQAVKLLLARGADASSRAGGDTPLASAERHEDCRALLKAAKPKRRKKAVKGRPTGKKGKGLR